MRIKFTAKPSANAGGEEFAVGEVYDVDEPSAWRWVRRKVAEIVEVETADAAPRKRRGRPRRSTREHADGADADNKTVG